MNQKTNLGMLFYKSGNIWMKREHRDAKYNCNVYTIYINTQRRILWDESMRKGFFCSVHSFCIVQPFVWHLAISEQRMQFTCIVCNLMHCMQFNALYAIYMHCTQFTCIVYNLHALYTIYMHCMQFTCILCTLHALYATFMHCMQFTCIVCNFIVYMHLFVMSGTRLQATNLWVIQTISE